MFVGPIFQRNTSCILCCPHLSHVLVNTGIFLRSQYTCHATSKTTTKKSATEIRDIFPEDLIREKRQQTGRWKSRQFCSSCLLVVDFQQALRLHKGPGFLLRLQLHLHRHMVVIRRRSQIAPPPPHPVHVTAIVGEAPPPQFTISISHNLTSSLRHPTLVRRGKRSDCERLPNAKRSPRIRFLISFSPHWTQLTKPSISINVPKTMSANIWEKASRQSHQCQFCLINWTILLILQVVKT